MRGAGFQAIAGMLALLGVLSAARAQTAGGFTPDPQPNATQEPAPGQVSGANSFGEQQARDAIAAKGFREVSRLVNDSNGLWRGTAQKDGREVSVSIDFKGNVHAE